MPGVAGWDGTGRSSHPGSTFRLRAGDVTGVFPDYHHPDISMASFHN